MNVQKEHAVEHSLVPIAHHGRARTGAGVLDCIDIVQFLVAFVGQHQMVGEQLIAGGSNDARSLGFGLFAAEG